MKKIVALFIVLVCFAQLGTARTNNSYQNHKKKSHTIFKQWLPQFHKTHKFTLPVIVYGPKEFERSKGTPKTEVDTFSLKGNSAAPYTMVVANAFCDDKEVTSSTIKLNGVQIFGPSDFKKNRPLLIKTVTLKQANTITVKISGKRGTHLLITILGKRSQQTDTTPPTLALTSPADGAITKDSTIIVSGTAMDASAVSVTINGEQAVVGASGEFSEELALMEGVNTIGVVATDASNNTSTVTRTVIKDVTPPQLTITNDELTITNGSSVVISGTVSDQTAVSVTVSGSSVPVTNGAFSAQVSLNEGVNEIAIAATDAAGNSSTATRMVRKDALPPIVIVSGTAEGMITNQSSVQISGSASDSTTVTVTVNGIEVLIEGGTFTYTATLNEGLNTVTVVVTDGAGNSTTVTRVVRRDTIAPELTINNEQLTITNQPSVTITGTAVDSTAVTVTVNGNVVPTLGGAFSYETALNEGTNTITITATDTVGNSSTVTRTIKRDSTPPTITITSPVNNFVTNLSPIQLTGRVTDSSTTAVAINGNYVTTQADGSFSETIMLIEGLNTIEITATDGMENSSAVTRTIVLDTTPPELTVNNEQLSITNEQFSIISGTVSDSTLVTVTVNGDTALIINGAFSADAPLAEGANTVTITATDAAGNATSITRTVILDTTNPALTVTLPPDNSVTNQTPIEISGTVVDSTTTAITVNGSNVPVSDGSFSMLYTLAEGLNSFTIAATDGAGNSSAETRTVRLDTQAPFFSIIQPENGIETRITPAVISGSIADSTPVSLTINGAFVPVNGDGSFVYTLNLIEGANPLMFIATDEVGNSTTEMRTLNYTTLPPDPIVVAPPLDTTVTTNPYDATKFIYAGPDTIQKGVAPGTIVATRVAIIRGKVLANCGIPLFGVNISILNHPEFGYTQSRADGMFDMVVNGGGLLTVKYSKSGFLPAQRQITTPWLDYISADSIMMIAVDPNVTTVASNIDSMQSAQTSVVSDADGTRRATIIFERYTQGTMSYSDGTTQPLSTFALRGTEYGRASECVRVLPGTLPPQSALGYGIELNCDEAINTNAKLVTFDKPFALYVDNFLVLPTGSKVPTAYFDSTKGIWMPVNDGRVVKIISIIDGVANLDVIGNGVVSPQGSLDALGISPDEQTRLVSLFTAGQSFMRIEADRLSPWSFSWPFGPPLTAMAPSLPAPTKQMLDKDCTTSGSIIGIQNQSLGETLPITGTPFSIYYKSTRVPGRKDAFSLDIPLTGPTLPPGLNRIYLEVSVAGQFHVYEFTPALDLSYNFVWNGKDAYGRRAQGKQTISTSIGYNYNANFQIPQGGQSFGNMSGTSLNKRRSYTTSTMWQYWSGLVGMWDETSRSLGAWSLNFQHLYDAIGKTLHLGDGNTRSAENANLVVHAFAGGGNINLYLDTLPHPSLQSDLRPQSVVYTPDGNIYISDRAAIYRVGTDGMIRRIAGKGSYPRYNGDSIPAIQASFGADGIDVGPDGTIYFADVSNHRIRKITPDGMITTIAGMGIYGYTGWGFSGDGGPGIDATLTSPSDVALAPDGSLYICDGQNKRIRKLNPNGIITTVSGNGTGPYNGDNIPATSAALNLTNRIALGKDGSLYLGNHKWSRLRKIAPDGIIRTVAGTGSESFSGDCGPGISAAVKIVKGIDVDGNNNVVFGEVTTLSYDPRMRRLSSGGIISTIAGNGATGYNGDGLPARATNLSAHDIEFSPDGSIYVGEEERVRKISKPFPQFSLNTNVIPSEDGNELFIFDYAGKHQQTLDALTGVVKYDFYYDGKGRLTHIRDIDSLFTTIERDSVTGEATAIISPYGQKTYLYINNSSYLDSLTNPAGETHRFTYDDGGLMKTMRNAKNQLYKFSYDSLGRLIKDEDPLGGFKALSRTEIYDNGCSSCGKIGFEVTMTTALGKKSSYRVERVTPGILVTQTDENGQKTYTRENPDGTTTITSPDSTVVTVTAGPDPRFGMMVPVDKSKTTRKPSGLTMTESHGRKISQMTGLQVTGLTDSSFVNGRLSKSEYNGTTRTITSTSPLGRKKVSFLDMKGRVIKDSIPGITPTVNAYNSKGQLVQTRQGTRVTTFTYDNVGRLASIQDPILRVSNTVYDSVGRTLQQILPDGRTIGYSYDANSNMTSLTPPSKPAHEFAYDDVDQKTVYDPPMLPVDGSTPTGYEYNLDKQNVKVIRADSTTLVFVYDTTGGAFGGNSHIKTLTFDRGTISYDYNAKSGLVTRTISADRDTLLYTYDGTMPVKEEWRGSVNGSVTTQYDNNYRVIAQKVNGSDSIGFTYNNDDQLTSVGALTLVYNSSNGLPVSDTLGKVSTAISYSSLGEVSGIDAKYSGSPIFTTSYTRDSLGRITTLSETIQGESKTFRYGYDLAGRLEKVWRNDTLASQYVYDSTGNRLAKITPTTIDSGSYDAQDRMLTYGNAQYIYSKNGELQWKVEGSDTTFYSYDALGNLAAVRLPNGDLIEYLIDANNRRVGKKHNGQIVKRWIYESALRPIAELDSNNSITARFVYTLQENVPVFLIKSGMTYRLITDHLGSVRLVINASTGLVASRFDYDEYGNINYQNDSLELPFCYAGGLFDKHTRLIRFGVRDYESFSGRWTSKDPINFDGGDANLYGYVANDPINKKDPQGKDAFLAFDMIVMAVYALSNYDVVGATVFATAATGVVIADAIEQLASAGMKSTSGETQFTKMGREAHAKYNPGPNYRSLNKEIPGSKTGYRPDAVDYTNKIVRELKPNNPRAIQRGLKQIDKYIKELERLFGKGWTGHVDTY